MAEYTSQVTFRVTDEQYQMIEEIARRERRKPNEVARALLTRGTAAYLKDRQLFEPENNGETSNGPIPHARQETVVVKTRSGRSAGDKRKRKIE